MKNLLLTLSEKRQAEYERKLGEKSGVFVENPPSVSFQNTFVMLGIKVWIVFFILMGSAECYMSGFGVSYNYSETALMAIIVSILLCIVNIRTSVTVVSYAGISYGISYILRDRFDAVFSGIVAIVNQSYNLIMNRYKFPSVDGFPEMVADRSYTVGLVMFLGLVIAGMIVAFFVCRFMNVMFVVLITSLPLGLVLFFGGKPSTESFCMLVAAWFATALVKFSGKFGRTKPKRRMKVYYYGNSVYYRQVCDGTTVLQSIILSAAVLAICSGIFLSVFDRSAFDNNVKESPSKQSIDNIVRDNMIIAFSNYKNYKFAGYQPMGQLGFYGETEPDFETDLTVTLVPYTTERIYFKSYTGSVYKYKNNRWESLPEGKNYINREEASSAARKSAADGIRAKIKIFNNGVAGPIGYLPYYTDFEENPEISYVQDDIIKGNLSVNESMEIIYHPFKDSPSSEVSSDYESYVYANYLEVPEKLNLKLKSLCGGEGFKKGDSELDRKICDYFQNNFEYNFNSGRLPWQTDFVEYFLFENKSGVCAHFASAAVLIYRSLGIPARYVEGYCADYMQIMQGKRLENENPNDWLSGITPLSSSVMEAELSDYNAHAWVEVYKDGEGWVVVDPTPYVDELELKGENEEISTFDKIMEYFGQAKDKRNKNVLLKRIFSSVSEILLSLIEFIIAFAVTFFLLRLVVGAFIRFFVRAGGNAAKIANMEYTYLEKLSIYGGVTKKPLCMRDFASVLCEKGMEEKAVNNLYRYTEKALFSKNGIEKNELKKLVSLYAMARKTVIKSMPFTKKISCFFRMCKLETVGFRH